MANGNASTAAPKKRGRPPGTKRAKSAKGQSASNGIRHNVDRQRKKKGRPKKSGSVPSGHVLISKKVLKEFRKGIANLEAALGSFANALRVLE